MRCLLILAAVVVAAVDGKVFNECGVAKELVRHGIPKGDLPNWVCLIKSESSFNTAATHKNKDGSTDYGLFQINNRYWCNEGAQAGKDCHVRCKDLLTDDITKAVNCAKIIKKRHGYNAWYGWKNHCQGRPLPSVTHCF